MTSNFKQEGYEYQDLVSAYFIIATILNETDSSFTIDTKEYDSDKFDDLTISNKFGLFKKQIKYSNEDVARVLSKKELSSKTSYSLAIDLLYKSWNSLPQQNESELRLCLAWDEPFLLPTNIKILFFVS